MTDHSVNLISLCTWTVEHVFIIKSPYHLWNKFQLVNNQEKGHLSITQLIFSTCLHSSKSHNHRAHVHILTWNMPDLWWQHEPHAQISHIPIEVVTWCVTHVCSWNQLDTPHVWWFLVIVQHSSTTAFSVSFAHMHFIRTEIVDNLMRLHFDRSCYMICHTCVQVKWVWRFTLLCVLSHSEITLNHVFDLLISCALIIQIKLIWNKHSKTRIMWREVLGLLL